MIFHHSKEVVLDMLDLLFLLILSFVSIYVIKLILNNNLFIHYLKITIKFVGLDIEIKSKEKSAPSDKE
jgi:hypothetical protein